MEKMGKIFWQDLTVDNAVEIREFYCGVVGWTYSNVKQGDYNDFNIIDPEDGEVVAGICHRKGELANFPPQWLNYVMVKNLSLSMDKCLSLGGKILEGPKPMGNATIAIIQDPAGAFLALMSEDPAT